MYNQKMELKKLRREEWAMINPVHSKKDSEYNMFVKRLSKNTDFYETREKNDKKFNKPMAIKNIKKIEWFGIFMVSFLCGLISFTGAQMTLDTNRVQSHIYNKQKENMTTILYTTIGALLGFATGVVSIKNTRDLIRKQDVEDFYNRLALRLFDHIKVSYPELSKDMLQKHNPETTQIITELLIANMDKYDSQKLRDMAFDLACKIKADEIDINQYRIVFKDAMRIIKNALDNNNNLYKTVVLVFQGWLPTTFNVSKTGQKMITYLMGNGIEK